MKTIDIDQATESLADYARTAGEGPLIVTSEGRPIAAVLPIENADEETVSLSTSSEFLDLIEQSHQRWKREGGISTEEMRRRLGEQE